MSLTTADSNTISRVFAHSADQAPPTPRTTVASIRRPKRDARMFDYLFTTQCHPCFLQAPLLLQAQLLQQLPLQVPHMVYCLEGKSQVS